MRVRKCVSLVCLCVLTAAVGPPPKAYACYLYVGKTPVATDALATCFSFAQGVAQQNLHNVRKSPDEVAGETSDAYASITCIAPGHGEQAIAVVSVVSNSGASASNLRDLLVAKMKGSRTY